MSLPPRIKNTPSQFDPQVWRGNTFQDPAAYLIDPGQIRAVGSKPDPGMLAHVKRSIQLNESITIPNRIWLQHKHMLIYA